MANDDDVTRRIKEIIADRLNRNMEELGEDARIMEDLGADSLDTRGGPQGEYRTAGPSKTGEGARLTLPIQVSWTTIQVQSLTFPRGGGKTP